jgi:hypothetical protein
MLSWYARVIAVALVVIVSVATAFDSLKLSADARLNEEALKILKTWEQLGEGYAVVELSIPEGCFIEVKATEMVARGRGVTNSYTIDLPLQTPITLTGKVAVKVSREKVWVVS